ncbi:MAG: AAA family ATPase [Firmicutes bacterium]|jgi:vesicle-fusing ATPase|nr:AAA family ATPase [Bacillota bacterium]
MIKSIAVGVITALLTFLLWNGIDVWPVILILGLVAALTYTGVWNKVVQARHGRQVTVGSAVRVTFNDIGGQATAKNELKEALEFVRNPERIQDLGIRPLKGILLTGPPGTGKTMLAKAAAEYTDSAFLSASGSEFVEMYAGVGAQRVRQLFVEARQLAKRQGQANAIIFIDEIEVMAGKRGQHHSHLEYDQTLNQLLVEMDGMGASETVRILVMAATNRGDLLDPALLRPGRFDRQVRVDLPDREGRLAILALHTRNKPLASDVDLVRVAQETFGFSGAHLESVCNEAAIMALRDNSPAVLDRHLMDAVDKVLLGERMDRNLRAGELNRVAVHEGGHALVAEVVNPGSVSSVTISPRGMALGFVRQAPEDDRLIQTVSELKADIQVCLAGSTAERIMLGEQSTGAANDFEKAWDISRRLVLSGLSSLGVVHEEALSPESLYQAIQDIITQQQAEVDRIITDRDSHLRQLAQQLLESETLSGDAVRGVLRGSDPLALGEATSA